MRTLSPAGIFGVRFWGTTVGYHTPPGNKALVQGAVAKHAQPYLVPVIHLEAFNKGATLLSGQDRCLIT